MNNERGEMDRQWMIMKKEKTRREERRKKKVEGGRGIWMLKYSF